MRSVALWAGVLLVAALPVAPARADEGAELSRARAEVAAATVRMDQLTPRVQRALSRYEQSLAGVAQGVSASVIADQEADAAAGAAADARRQSANSVRALYMSGGGVALVASVLDAPSATEALHRLQYVDRLVTDQGGAAAGLRAAADQARADAAALEAESDQASSRAADVQVRYAELAQALAQAQAEVQALSDRATQLAEAQALAAQVAALNAAAEAAGAARVATARATAMPPLFERLYHRAAATCPGLSWTVLAAIGQVESGHGSNPGVSYAGARGPMQFMPATFAAYGVDGDRDGDTDIDDPTDAVFSAANYLCANDAGSGKLEGAIWNYNHAQWYVDLVLRLAAQYAELG